jgi:hypothetical protein
MISFLGSQYITYRNSPDSYYSSSSFYSFSGAVGGTTFSDIVYQTHFNGSGSVFWSYSQTVRIFTHSTRTSSTSQSSSSSSGDSGRTGVLGCGALSTSTAQINFATTTNSTGSYSIPSLSNTLLYYTSRSATTVATTLSSKTITESIVVGSTFSYSISNNSLNILQNTLVYASERFYTFSNLNLIPIFDVPSIAFTSRNISARTSAYTRNVLDTSEATVGTTTATFFSIVSSNELSSYAKILVENSFPQKTNGTYVSYRIHRSTSLITSTIADVYYGYSWESTGDNFGQSSNDGSIAVAPIQNSYILNPIVISSYIGDGASLPSGTWVSTQNRSIIPAWYGGNAEIYLNGFGNNYMMSRTINMPPVGSFVSTKTNSNAVKTTITVSIDASYKCSSTWSYGTTKSSGTMQLQTYNQNSIYIDTQNEILGGYPEINNAYTFVRGPGAFVVTSGDTNGFTTQTQSFTNATSFASAMNNTITAVNAYPLISGLSVIPVMTYDF